MEMAQGIRVYLEYKGADTRTTEKKYRCGLLKFAEIAGKPVEEIVMGDVVAFKVALAEKYMPSTCWYYVTILRGFLRYWHEEGIAKLNPDRISAPRYRMNPYHAVTQQEFEMLDDFLETEPANLANLQQRLMLKFLWETGMRVSELCAIKLFDVNQSEPRLQINTLKNDLLRWVFWSDETHLLLLEFIRGRNRYAGDTLFTTYEGKMHPKSVQRFIKDLTGKVGIPNVVPHSFRHGKAHRILRSGGTIVDVQNILGHKNLMSSQRYTQWEPQELQTRANNFLT